MGHHQQDLLETRIIRLIRGTGPQGLKSMAVWKNPLFRPFLEIEPIDLRQYLNGRGQGWIEDPTNFEVGPIRNWLRKSWLPTLEKKRPGALQCFGNSLEQIVEGLNKKNSNNLKGKSILRNLYISLSQVQQRQLLARWFLNNKIEAFTHSQIKEIQKRLDKNQIEYTFRVGKMSFFINAEQIKLKKE